LLDRCRSRSRRFAEQAERFFLLIEQGRGVEKFEPDALDRDSIFGGSGRSRFLAQHALAFPADDVVVRRARLRAGAAASSRRRIALVMLTAGSITNQSIASPVSSPCLHAVLIDGQRERHFARGEGSSTRDGRCGRESIACDQVAEELNARASPMSAITDDTHSWSSPSIASLPFPLGSADPIGSGEVLLLTLSCCRPARTRGAGSRPFAVRRDGGRVQILVIRERISCSRFSRRSASAEAKDGDHIGAGTAGTRLGDDLAQPIRARAPEVDLDAVSLLNGSISWSAYSVGKVA